MKIEYSSNNSGGYWWLTDGDWKALEDAGWEVQWGGHYFCNSNWDFSKEKPRYLEEECNEKDCPGHRLYTSYEEAVNAGDKFLGALAHYATVEKPTIEEAIEEWERITGGDAQAEGCHCCGQPHNFSEVD